MAEFLDTNVLLYAYDSSAGERHDRCRDLTLTLARSNTAAISVQVLQEFYVNATRKIAVPLRPSAARQRLDAFGRWLLHRPGAPDVSAASKIAEENQISFWDAMIVRSASQLGCELVWSEDLNAGQVIAGVTIASPFDR